MGKLRGVPLWLEQGRLQELDGDVLGIVQQVKEISPRLSVYYDEWDDGFTITETSLDGSTESLVFRANALDQRVIDRLRQADHWHGQDVPEAVVGDDEDFLSRLEVEEEEFHRKRDRAGMDKLMDAGERLAWAMQFDGRGMKAQIQVVRHYNKRSHDG